MEEKKLARFSVKEWEANPKRSVVTNTGKDVRILCVDRIGGEKILPVVALVLCEGAGSRAEALCEFDADGIQNGNKDDNGWVLYFKETYADVLADELLANGFRLLMEKSEERTFYKTINAGKENRYDIFINTTQKMASYTRIGSDGMFASVRIPLNEGMTCAEIQDWAEKTNKAIQRSNGAKIKCRDLMIGDWIQDEHGFRFYIVGLGEDYAYADFERNEGDLWEFDNEIEPCYGIPLDEVREQVEAVTEITAEFDYLHEFQQYLRVTGKREEANKIKL